MASLSNPINLFPVNNGACIMQGTEGRTRFVGGIRLFRLPNNPPVGQCEGSYRPSNRRKGLIAGQQNVFDRPPLSTVGSSRYFLFLRHCNAGCIANRY